MKFSGFERLVLGSPAKMQVVRFLLGGGSGSQREIARMLEVSAMTVARVMKDLAATNLITPRKTGSSLEWRLNTESWAYRALSPLKQVDTDPISALKSLLSFPHTGVSEAYLTGSVAAETEGADSDIDILLVVDTERTKVRLQHQLEPLKGQCLRLFGNILSPFILTAAETSRHRILLEKARRTGVKLA